MLACLCWKWEAYFNYNFLLSIIIKQISRAWNAPSLHLKYKNVCESPPQMLIFMHRSVPVTKTSNLLIMHHFAKSDLFFP